MIGPSIIPIVVDTDNALGSHARQLLPGDVDDAFAISYLLKSKHVHVKTILSVGGNAGAEVCHRNNMELCRVAEAEIQCIQGYNRKNIGNDSQLIGLGNCDNYLSLGPLTNFSFLLKHNFSANRIWMTLGRIKTKGSFPPIWPIEFNATQDLVAFVNVFQSNIPKTIVPLDVAIQLRFESHLADELKKTKIGNYLLIHIKHWQVRNILLKGRSHFPVWDLVSAMALANPETCEIKKGKGYLFPNGLLLCDVNNEAQTFHNRKNAISVQDIDIVASIDSKLIWNLFFKALQNP